MGGVCSSCAGGGRAKQERKDGELDGAALVDAVACGGKGPDGGAAKPPDEAERVGFLCGLGILDSPADPRFDDITKLLCTIFNVPIAIVSLVDTERQWFKSICGLSATETDRRSSFCAWTLLPPHPEVLVVPDARDDARFADNPLVVGEPKIRFYAGAPLVASNGARLGSLCVIDTVPRSIDAEQCNILVNFAEVVMREIEKEKTRLLEAARLRSSAADLLRVIDGFRECVMLADAGGGSRWPVLFVNDACARGAGVDPGADAGRDFWEMFALAEAATSAPKVTYSSSSCSSSSSPAAELVARVAAREAFHVELVRLPRKRGDSGGHDGGGGGHSSASAPAPAAAARFSAHFRPASTAHLDGAPAIGIPTVAPAAGGGGGGGGGSGADALYFITITPEEGGDSAAAAEAGAASPSPSAAAAAAAAATDPLAEVELGLLIGQGAYGRVYRGIWNGAPVAVKIIPHLGSPAAPSAAAPASGQAGGKASSPAGSGGGGSGGRGSGATPPGSEGKGGGGARKSGSGGGAGPSPGGSGSGGAAGADKGGAEGIRGALEMMHSVDLSHPGIVQTFKSAQRTIVLPGPPSSSSPSGKGGGGRSSASPPSTSPLDTGDASRTSAAAKQAASRVLTETWLVMEYCDRGSLQDAVDRGVFFERRPAGGGASFGGAGGGVGSGGSVASGVGSGGSVRGGTSFVRLGESVDREKLLSEEAAASSQNGSRHGSGGGGAASSSSSPAKQSDALSASPPAAPSPPASPPAAPSPPASISSRPNMPFIVSTATEIAAAMAYLHSLDVLHGDLTGGNVLLSSTSAFGGGGGGATAGAASPSSSAPPVPSSSDLRGWTAKVADFGLARVLSCDAISTGTYGTVTHMPPELLTAGKLSKAADVYAFGVLLWEMHTGKRPWAGLLQMQVIFAVTIRRRRLAFPATSRELYPRFVALAEECMCPEAEGRPSFEEVRERLKSVEGAPGFGGGEGTTASPIEIEEVV